MFARIPLTNGGCAMVDPEDVALVSEYKWYASKRKNGDVSGVRAKSGSVLMHRLLTDAPKGMEVDHINGNPLDNRKANLRVCTHAENARNQRGRNKWGLKGVFRVKGRSATSKCWSSCIRDPKLGRSRNLGYYHTPAEAHLAYRAAAKELHGEFARFN